MARIEDILTATEPKPASDAAPTPKSDRPLMFRDASPAIVLDMGEASREEGFRLNGCR